jgi:hypothetical protein
MMRPIDIVREYFPKASDDEARDVLWGCTGWPHFFDTGNGRTVQDALRDQLKEIADRSKGDPFIACCIAEQEMDEAMARGKRERNERIKLAAYFLWEKESGVPVSEEESRKFWERAEEETF